MEKNVEKVEYGFGIYGETYIVVGYENNISDGLFNSAWKEILIM